MSAIEDTYAYQVGYRAGYFAGKDASLDESAAAGELAVLRAQITHLERQVGATT